MHYSSAVLFFAAMPLRLLSVFLLWVLAFQAVPSVAALKVAKAACATGAGNSNTDACCQQDEDDDEDEGAGDEDSTGRKCSDAKKMPEYVRPAAGLGTCCSLIAAVLQRQRNDLVAQIAPRAPFTDVLAPPPDARLIN